MLNRLQLDCNVWHAAFNRIFFSLMASDLFSVSYILVCFHMILRVVPYVAPTTVLCTH